MPAVIVQIKSIKTALLHSNKLVSRNSVPGQKHCVLICLLNYAISFLSCLVSVHAPSKQIFWTFSSLLRQVPSTCRISET